MRFFRALSAFVVAALVMSGVVVATSDARALSGNDFQAGLIISDSVFFNSVSMDENQIAAFLRSKVSTCDAGYICLKDYSQATTNIAADTFCSGYQGRPYETAATIIYKVAQACLISPKVLLVLLEKEQSLVTDTWPGSWQYRAATGVGCPDTAPCDPAISGFFYQVYHGARAFQRYVKTNSSYNFGWNRFNTIQYHPNAACGTRVVYIQNMATAALYNYTPYTPNQSALNNLGGVGDTCSAYGNRNFWALFSGWFGSPISGIETSQAKALVDSLYNDVLGRLPDSGGKTGWTSAILNQGQSASYVVGGILYSPEYYRNRIIAAYRDVLGRQSAPEASGVDYWLGLILNGQVGVDEVSMTFTKSYEYYLRSGGTPESFTNALFNTMLNRAPSASELTTYSSLIRANNKDSAISGVYNSWESASIRLDRIYRTYLQRGADSQGVNSWVPGIIAKGDQYARDSVVNSYEYFLRASMRFPQS